MASSRSEGVRGGCCCSEHFLGAGALSLTIKCPRSCPSRRSCHRSCSHRLTS